MFDTPRNLGHHIIRRLVPIASIIMMTAGCMGYVLYGHIQTSRDEMNTILLGQFTDYIHDIGKSDGFSKSRYAPDLFKTGPDDLQDSRHIPVSYYGRSICMSFSKSFSTRYFSEPGRYVRPGMGVSAIVPHAHILKMCFTVR